MSVGIPLNFTTINLEQSDTFEPVNHSSIVVEHLKEQIWVSLVPYKQYPLCSLSFLRYISLSTLPLVSWVDLDPWVVICVFVKSFGEMWWWMMFMSGFVRNFAQKTPKRSNFDLEVKRHEKGFWKMKRFHLKQAGDSNLSCNFQTLKHTKNWIRILYKGVRIS